MPVEGIQSEDLVSDDPSWPIPADGGRRARQGRHASVLEAILEPDNNLVVWRRGGTDRALSSAARAYAAWLATGDFEVALDRRGRPEGLDLPLGAGRDELLDDWRFAVSRFDDMTSGACIDAKIGVVRTDKCRLYHADFNRLRWLCTYAGPGTEWVADGDVDRAACPLGELPADEVNRRLVPDAGRVQHVAVGDVLVLKGNGFPGNEGYGAVHRSPPIAGSGQRRLVLTLSWL